MLLFETIKVEDGRVENIEWHNRRCNKTREKLFSTLDRVDLREYIQAPSKGLFRCRITYRTQVESVEFFPYQPKEIQHFKIVESEMEYPFKYNNREEINHLLQNTIKDAYGEIIIEKRGLLTDTSIANIALYDGQSWFTPKQPLLEGTTRARLLEKGFLREKDIERGQIKHFSHFALMNAMIGFQIQKNITIN